ncbi:hypothetical protein PAPYR_5 [Paratrimastix pyriformis]|uniref:Peptidase M10 metallopeptidase domain-containing protein n=1 Tax=Paratrimastix pyriformis TaxID=342808 RepID=A0ABQ8UW57_9EUKA|nr:hypothetical protein PAPYR_5 [Paratrimastix pyriformis]
MRLLLLLIPLALCSEFTPIIPTTNVEVKQYGWVTNEIEHHPRADGWCGTKSSSMANGCSNTVCDDPVLVQSYLDSLKNDQLDAVTLKYRVHYFCDAEGKNCPVTDEMNSDQLGVFNKGYSPLKLSFSAVAHPIAKPRFFGSDMLMCDPSQVGDGEADVDCLSVQTGYDGGDFMCQTPCNPSDPAVCTIRALATEECECFCADLTLCTSAMLADGQCHDECNWAQTQWSNGSCCFEGATKCRDPLSPYRNWYSTDDIKAEVADTPTDHFNVYLGRMPASSSLLGYATFPWDEQATAGTGGGLVFNLRNHAWGIFNQSEMIGITALHELGHALGLWHPFHHVSEWDSDEVSGNTKAAICAAPCFEHSPSWGTGDMIQDTPPTPINFLCTDPAPCSQSHNGWCSDCAGSPARPPPPTVSITLVSMTLVSMTLVSMTLVSMTHPRLHDLVSPVSMTPSP